MFLLTQIPKQATQFNSRSNSMAKLQTRIFEKWTSQVPIKTSIRMIKFKQLHFLCSGISWPLFYITWTQKLFISTHRGATFSIKVFKFDGLLLSVVVENTFKTFIKVQRCSALKKFHHQYKVVRRNM